VLVLYDLSRRLLQSQDLDRRRVAELDRMAAQFAHEINNPLSGIRGAAQLLGRRLDGRNDLVEYTDMIVRQVDRLNGLVEALMALEAPVLRKQPVNIHKILNELILLERPAAELRGIVFEPQFDPSLPEVNGDAARLEQLFLNILRNAVAHCPDKLGRIRIATRMEHSYYVDREAERVSFLTVSVADNGPGLDDEAIEHVFSPMFSRRPGGHGMGLAIAGAIALAHDGRIRAANVPGGGAIFHVTLPLARTRDAGKGEPS
jgi:two-component system nitrogen regulation sensor histidine kinase GlnL